MAKATITRYVLDPKKPLPDNAAARSAALRKAKQGVIASVDFTGGEARTNALASGFYRIKLDTAGFVAYGPGAVANLGSEQWDVTAEPPLVWLDQGDRISVVTIAAAGAAAATTLPAALGLSASTITADTGEGSYVGEITGVPVGSVPKVTPPNAQKDIFTTKGPDQAGKWGLYMTRNAGAAGTIPITISADGALDLAVNITVNAGIAPVPPIVPGLQVSALNQGMQVSVVGFSGSSATRANTWRSRHYSTVPFRRFRIAIQKFTCMDSRWVCNFDGTNPVMEVTAMMWGRIQCDNPYHNGTAITRISGPTATIAPTRPIAQLSSTEPDGSLGKRGFYTIATTPAAGTGNVVAGNVINDEFFTGGTSQFAVQVGFQKQYQEAFTGLTPRQLCPFGEQSYMNYDRATTNTDEGLEWCDWVDPGETIPAFQFFGFFTTFQLPNTGTAGRLPYHDPGSNYHQRYVGYIDSTGSAIAALGGASDVALTATSITPATSAVAGDAGRMFTPCMMQFETTDNKIVTVGLGDSIGMGSGEGYTSDAAIASYGDIMGSPLGNRGYFMRGIYERNNKNAVNLSRGSDRAAWWVNPENSKFRRQMLVQSKAAWAFNMHGYNDSSTVSVARTNGLTVPAKGMCYLAGGATILMCDVPGVTGGSTPTGSVGDLVVDGTVTWRIVSTTAGSTNIRNAWNALGSFAAMNYIVKSLVAGIKIAKTTMTPIATSTDNYMTIAGQTAFNTGTGGATGNRGYQNSLVAANLALLQIDKLIDLNSGASGLENAPDTSIFVVAPGQDIPYFATADAGHPSSRGHDRVSYKLAAFDA